MYRFVLTHTGKSYDYVRMTYKSDSRTPRMLKNPYVMSHPERRKEM